MKKILLILVFTFALLFAQAGINDVLGAKQSANEQKARAPTSTPTPIPSSYEVQGTVSSTSSVNVSGLRVKILAKEISRENLLAEATTNFGGAYRASFHAATPVDIVVRVYNNQALLAASETRNNASRREVINVRITTQTDTQPSLLTRVINRVGKTIFSILSQNSNESSSSSASQSISPTVTPSPTPSPTPTITPTPSPTLTLTPTRTPTPTPPILAQPPAATWSCTTYDPTRRTFRLIWYWRTQPQAYDYKFTATNTVNGVTYYNDWTMKTRYPTSYVISDAPADTNIETTYLYASDSNRTNLSPLSPKATAFCASPTPTLMPTPTQNPSNLNLNVSLRFNQTTRVPTATVRNNTNVSAIFQGESIFIGLFCKENNPYSVFAECQEKRLSSFKDRLNTGEEIVINFTPLTNNQLESIDARVIAIDRNLDDIVISYSNLLYIFVPTPTPTSTPTPTNTPTPTTRSIQRDLVSDSLTFNAETRQSTLLVKLMSARARQDAVTLRESSGFVVIKWLNNSGTVIRENSFSYGQYSRIQYARNNNVNFYYEFDPPPDGASRYDVWIDDNVFIEPPDNNRLLGTVPQAGLPTPTPTPTSPTATPTPTTVPSNTPIPNIISPTPTLVDKKQSIIENLKYPVDELGNCKDKDDCQKYCDIPANLNACNEYAVKMGLRTREEAERIRNAVNVKIGPGGCNGQEECASFCDRPENLNVCLDYAEKNNLMNSDELSKTKKVLNVIVSGVKTPGDCKTPKQCQSYCSDNSRRDECVGFAKSAGLISQEEASQMQKDGIPPGGSGPGGCKSEEECGVYCSDESHRQECEKFLETSGFSQEEINKLRGGNKEGKPVCTTRDECEAFCKNPANAEACKNVVIKGGDISGPKEGIGEQMSKLRENINQMPEESKECLKKALGTDTYAKIMGGEVLTTPINGDVMQSCFSQGVQEYEQKMMPTKKPDDKDMVSTLSGDIQTSPTPQVQGASTKLSLLNIILNWLRR